MVCQRMKNVYCNPSSPCYEIGEETKSLSEQLWNGCGGGKAEYVDVVYRYLVEMEYDYELKNSPDREPWVEYLLYVDGFGFCIKKHISQTIFKKVRCQL